MPDMNSWPTGRLLSTAARLVEHSWNGKLAAAGLTHAGVIALDVLSRAGEPMSQANIAQKVRVQNQTMGKTLSRLQAWAYIRRHPSPSDRRSQIVSITDLGTEVINEAREVDRTILTRAAGDGDRLRKDLQSIIDLLSRNPGTTSHTKQKPGNRSV
ncbi:MarR family winged helix-turn-helix transcriptional regulator [Arthrobacter sedimenti]|uniref:MarR family winged helix-turn-helix transcriptional regulator n=1 Tax=Arthrobacter sedimenti TaxID=2694931 RepID=A0ABV8WM20_9MICC